ncbi:M48 family metalloprotease [Kribbella sp. NPDC050124]|uniref:M48 family metalloprotease n=1 Tax=Kribbella sp. NPDC050124 TaxID=3364114 RepID=UPI0037AD5636
MTSPGDPNDPNGSWRPNNAPGPQQNVPPSPQWGQLPPGASAGSAGQGGPRSGGRVEVSAATTLLTAVPWFFWSFVTVSWIAGIIGFGYGWILVALWLVSGAVVFVRPVEEWIARFLFRLRKPTLVEDQRIASVWPQLSSRAGVGGSNYSVWVQESEDANATPTPGHIVAVTTWSLYNLPAPHLEAVLAHELSHHLGGRTLLSLLSFWYSIPARCALIGVRALGRLMKAVPAVGCLVIGFLTLGYLGILLAVLTFDDSLVLPILFLTPFVAPPILAWLGRREVMQADRRAAAMGYGATIVQVLYGWQVQHQNMLGREANRRSQLMSSTPSLGDRVRALEGLAPPSQV